MDIRLERTAVMNFYAFFVASRCGVMGIRLNVTAGGGKGLFIEGFDKNGVHYFTYSLFSVLDSLRAEWSLRERKSLMSTVFNIKKYMGSFVTSALDLFQTCLIFFVLSRFPKLLPHSHDKS